MAQVAELLGVSKDTVRRLFADEPGTIDLGRRETARHKRRYRVLRIPAAVLDKVLNRKRVSERPSEANAKSGRIGQEET